MTKYIINQQDDENYIFNDKCLVNMKRINQK
jgi:hypothetical protein